MELIEKVERCVVDEVKFKDEIERRLKDIGFLPTDNIGQYSNEEKDVYIYAEDDGTFSIQVCPWVLSSDKTPTCMMMTKFVTTFNRVIKQVNSLTLLMSEYERRAS